MRLAVTAVEDQLVLIAPGTYGIELLKPDADWINEIVTSGTEGIACMLTHAFPVRLRVSFGGRSEICVDTSRRRRHVLTEKLFPNKQAAAGERRVIRFSRKRQEKRLA